MEKSSTSAKIQLKIDVIIPTFNRSVLLVRAIESVLSQSYKHFHLIIVDDGSTDETASVLEKYEHLANLTTIKQENRGVSAARNLAVKNSTSDWISFLDSDDEWLPHKLAAQASYLESHPQIHFLHAEEIWMRNGVRVNPKVKHRKSGDNLFQRSLEFCLISPSTVLMKRELFNRFGGFDETLEVCEDYDLWNKILAFEEAGFIQESLTKKYGGHADQLSTKFFAMDYWRIRSLLNLSMQAGLNGEKRDLVLNEVKKKASLLLKGYLKHQNLERHQEVLELLARCGQTV